jgi:glycosyltransferase involved in cell wall biosynthesis
MRLVLDIQVFPVHDAGDIQIDRYAAALVSAILSHSGRHELGVIINHSSEELLEKLQRDCPELFNASEIHVSRVPFVGATDSANHWHRAAAELAREHALLQIKPDVVLCAPLIKPAAVLLAQLRCSTIPTAIALSAVPCGVGPHAGEMQISGSASALSANGLGIKRPYPTELVLTASESSRRLLVDGLGLSPDRIIVIPAGIDEKNYQTVLSEAQASAVRSRFAISSDFILSINGGSRQSLEHLLEAYSLLPSEIRSRNRLLVIGVLDSDETQQLLELARSKGVADGELVVTRDASDDDLAVLYNNCKLVVLPGPEGGAAQQALKAMTYGAPVLGPDTSAIKEILGAGEALFDPISARNVSEKICQVLASQGLREKLKQDAADRVQRISSREVARQSFEILEKLYSQQSVEINQPLSSSKKRLRMAYVSPLPPERSGIADYTAELLPELAQYYDIELITDLSELADPVLQRDFRRLPFRDFEKSARCYDRILYHIGNSPFHCKVPALLERYPGQLVLHDFFLSHLFNKLQSIDGMSLWRNLYMSHGYPALLAYARKGSDSTVWGYPCNLAVLLSAAGIFVHSEHAMQLAREWFGISTETWKVIPQLRKMPSEVDRKKARRELGISPDAFLVCSFGFLSEAKLNDLLFWSWLGSGLSRLPNCSLVFVGGDWEGRPYRPNTPSSSQIRSTGYVSHEEYEFYLAAADVGVQLRSELSRGETPRSVLDCMAYGMATVVSTHPALTDLPDDSVLRMSENCSNAELINALETLYREPGYRAQLGKRAQEYVRLKRSPEVVARQYTEAIEESSSTHPVKLTNRVVLNYAGLMNKGNPADEELAAVAACLSENISVGGIRQLFIDVSILVAVGDYGTGIQRVTRGILAHLLDNQPPRWRVEPVFRRHLDTYRYARNFVRKHLGLDGFNLEDAPVAVNPGDVFVGLDWDAGIAIDDRAANWLLHHRQRGMKTLFAVYDILPLQHPEWFPPDMPSIFNGWLSRICGLTDGFACISRAVADDLLNWLEEHSALAPRVLNIGYFQLGSDVESSWASRGLSLDDQKLLDGLDGHEVFLMVGTVEPRKGHSQALSAMEHLWAGGDNVILIICGHQGWMVDAISERLRSHPERGHRLFWLEQATDELLLKLYSVASALLMASGGEGFGLPLIEAARHNLPIITRDLAVFREVAGEHAFYFSGNESTELAAALRTWLEKYRRGEHPRASSSNPPTWQQSTEQLLRIALEGTLYRRWRPPRTLEFACSVQPAAAHRAGVIAGAESSRTETELENPSVS